MVLNSNPIVYWSQNLSKITLKVDLSDIKDPNISLSESHLDFYVKSKSNRYSFELVFYSGIDPQKSNYQILPNTIEFVLKKSINEWWPRLTCHPQKPAWLKVDIDNWHSPNFLIKEKLDIMQDYPEMYKKLHKEEYGYIKEDMKKVYLVIYNFLQFIGFCYISLVMFVRYCRDGPESMPGTYSAVGGAFRFCQLLQFLEVMHPLFGYTKGGIMTPMMQTTGRFFILFCMIESEPRMQTKPVVFYLFFAWALIELIRYPYYISQLYKKDIALLTWLRYTIWIPLFPLGVLCEGIIVLRCIPYFEETKKFTVSLPNSWNFAFHLPSFLRIYLLFMIIPGMYFVMSHLYRARVNKLGPKSWRKSQPAF
ncbi:very-long-chain (3R)-3-hydroxyacyl-CoA dehydratase 3-like [Ctenocephalides felis]|uniref:very-long-chain (3R)-3-hydroxyacyl-CoA dehydratase 3-like n=1 Tax=Ctenocephalides felis TaxID=7515 RepID=UPI000E6E24F5|nr:very-long-chain (3R)-3-hydroxyacyl-CoA dehydratase 3-like [Ctenocephalides felis]